MSRYKILISVILLTLLISNCKEDLPVNKPDELITYSILLSSIGDQTIFEGTSMQIHFAAIDKQLETLKYSIKNLPPFIKLIHRTNGRGYLQIDATKGTKGTYKLELIADNNQELGIQIFQLEVLPIPGNVLYLSPKSTNLDAKGTHQDPLPSLALCTEANLTIPAGTYLVLQEGFHGKPNFSFSGCHIYAAVNANPVISGITFHGVEASKMIGIEVSPEGNAPYQKGFSITIDSLSSKIAIQNCQIRTTKDSKEWTQDQWDERTGSGLMVYGQHCLIKNNLFENVFHALQTDANHTKVLSNVIDRFGGDAIRNTGDDNSYTSNLIKNAVVDDYSDPDGNHDDCFQSWTFGAPIRNITLKDNIAISCLEPGLPLKSRVVQGIACFDGFEENWLITNNIVAIDHPHGIALFGAKNCTVTNNTVLRNPYQFFSFESDPWIMINNHKDGRPSMNNTISNNLSGALEIKDSLGVTKDNLVLSGKYETIIEDYQGWDFRSKE